MAILKQNEDTQAVYLGWYGQCGDPVCKEFNLNEVSSEIEKVFQFTENGTGIKTYITDVPDYMVGFDKLTCGNPYYIVLKKGTGELNIPDFVTGYHDEKTMNFGMITKNCTNAYTKPPVDDEKEKPPVQEKPCTKDFRICPDGSTVGRDGFMDCNFPPCGFDKTLHENMRMKWKEKQNNHYKFDFNWSCYCTEEMRQVVTLYVRYEKIYKIVKKESEQEISLAQNEGIEESSDKKAVPMKYLSMTDLFTWVESELKKYPFSVSAEYTDETGFMSRIYIDKEKDIADEEIGFSATNFEILDNDGKCPSDYRRCKDGTILKRDPNNDCKFPECPDVVEETPKSVDLPKLEYRWLKSGSLQFLQIKNIQNPWRTTINEDDSYLSWRTVYGSREVNPIEVNSPHWKHALVAYNYTSAYGEVDQYDDVTIGIDDDNRNQLIIMLGEESEFLPNPDTIENASHLYIFKNDKETSSHKAWSYPRIIKVDTKRAQDVICTEDAKVCEDGSVVVRNPNNNCEFDLCPGEETIIEDETPFSIEEGMGDVPITPSPYIDDLMIDETSFTEEEENELTPTPSSSPFIDDLMIDEDKLSEDTGEEIVESLPKDLMQSEDDEEQTWYSLE